MYLRIVCALCLFIIYDLFPHCSTEAVFFKLCESMLLENQRAEHQSSSSFNTACQQNGESFLHSDAFLSPYKSDIRTPTPASIQSSAWVHGAGSQSVMKETY